jgi:flavodoxin
MNIAIIYDSKTGKTADAARVMARRLKQDGHICDVDRVQDADPNEVAKADLLLLGSWTHGLFIIGQHATREYSAFVERLPDLSGRRVAVFCTYLLSTGRMLRKMRRQLEKKGAQVIGEFKSRGRDSDEAFERFAAQLSSE